MDKKEITLSVALAVYNEEGNLHSCLQALSPIADEIVVVDGGSSDATVTIAKDFGAIVIETNNPPIFHINKQKALDACHGKWILQMDADEIVTPVLIQEIKNITTKQKPDFVAYEIPRKNYFLGHWMRKGGQYPDYVVRLFLKEKGSFPCKSVHEQIRIDGDIGKIKEPLLHYPYRTFHEYWVKALRYKSLTAKELATSELPKTLKSAFMYLIAKPVNVFFALSIRHKGIFDGLYGLIFAFFSALQYPMAYIQYVYGKNIN